MTELCQVLDIIDENKDFTYSRVCKELNGVLNQVGKGSYGTVFGLTENQVLKIYQKHDLAYLTFLKTAKERNSVHFPGIYEQGHYRRFRYVILERVEAYTPLWGCPEAHIRSLRDEFTARAFGSVEASERLPETIRQALAIIAPLGEFFGLDIWRRNLGVRGEQLIFLDPVCNSKTSKEDFEERPYVYQAA